MVDRRPREALPVDWMMSAVERRIVAVGSFVVSADEATSSDAVRRRSVPVAVAFDDRIVAAVDVAVTVGVMSTHCRTVVRGVVSRSGVVTSTVYQILDVRALVVAVSVLIIPGVVSVALRPVVRRRSEPVALLVGRVERAVEVRVVAERSAFALRVRRGEVSADVGARCRRVRRIEGRVALPVHEVATDGSAHGTSRHAVVTGFVFVVVVSV